MNRATSQGLKTYRRSVIATLPLLERLIYEYAGREGIIRIVEDMTDTGAAQGARA